jgi:mannan endo-1,6-alpha-mannosidase
MDYYHNGINNTDPVNVGLLPFPPYYWWESGAMWGGLVDYYSYTKDESYVNTTIRGLTAQKGPNNDYIVPEHKFDEVRRLALLLLSDDLIIDKGNDDQAFWGFALMSALENQYPSPPADQPQWLELAEALFDNQASRWDTTSCGGGLKWQIYPENAYGYDYKNSISNGGFFQTAARLARYTGDQKYLDWAVKSWDWCQTVGLISPTYDVYDGTNDLIGCVDQDQTRWSYNVAVFIEGAAALYNLTNSDIWMQRTQGLLDASKAFFSPFSNASNIMFEAACEPNDSCNTDQQSFKAYLARWLAKTSVLAPFTAATIRPMLEASALAAAASCSGSTDGVTCGTKWYTGGWDGTWGAGQQLAAMEAIQALAIADAGAPYSKALNHIQPRNPSRSIVERSFGARRIDPQLAAVSSILVAGVATLALFARAI